MKKVTVWTGDGKKFHDFRRDVAKFVCSKSNQELIDLGIHGELKFQRSIVIKALERHLLNEWKSFYNSHPNESSENRCLTLPQLIKKLNEASTSKEPVQG
jgi:hypothetical protein